MASHSDHAWCRREVVWSVTKWLQALCLLFALVALGFLAGLWWAVLVGGVLGVVLLELDDLRGN